MVAALYSARNGPKPRSAKSVRELEPKILPNWVSSDSFLIFAYSDDGLPPCTLVNALE
jgi:hypothetical protein